MMQQPEKRSFPSVEVQRQAITDAARCLGVRELTIYEDSEQSIQVPSLVLIDTTGGEGNDI